MKLDGLLADLVLGSLGPDFDPDFEPYIAG